jgi:heat-inducible transcriptional repressor
MLDERKAAILRAIVREHITTGQPVGSSHVARSPEVSVSSATIRNEMAVLEQEGYLRQPHTSAGRVPTDLAYRAYVDRLTEPGQLDAIRAQQVRAFFDSAHGALERMLQDTTRLLAKVTNYAAVVMAPGSEAAEVRSVQLVSLSSHVVMAVAVLSNGSVENETVELGEDVSDAVVAAAGVLLSGHLVGRSLVGLPPLPKGGDESVLALATAALDALRRHAAEADEHLYVGGAASLANAFEAVDVVRSVLHTLEEQYVVVSLMRDLVDRGLTVAIGTEHGVPHLAACSVVVAPYLIDGEPVGTVGLLGPTRMNYPQALAAVDVVSRHLGERLSEGER